MSSSPKPLTRILDAEEFVTGNAYLGSTLVQSVNQGNVAWVPQWVEWVVFNGAAYQMTLVSVRRSLQFDRVVIDPTENHGPELFDNVSSNLIREMSSSRLPRIW